MPLILRRWLPLVLLILFCGFRDPGTTPPTASMTLQLCWSTCGSAFALDQHTITQFHQAAGRGDLATVQAFLNQGIPVNAHSPEGETALHFAAAFGHREIVQLLLAHHATIRATTQAGGTALHWAAQGGYREIVQTLLQLGAEVNAATRQGVTSSRR